MRRARLHFGLPLSLLHSVVDGLIADPSGLIVDHARFIDRQEQRSIEVVPMLEPAFNRCVRSRIGEGEAFFVTFADYAKCGGFAIVMLDVNRCDLKATKSAYIRVPIRRYPARWLLRVCRLGTIE